MSDLQVLYKSEAFLHEELVVQTLFTEIKKSSFRMNHLINSDNREIALVDCGFAAYDYELKKLTSLPEVFSQKIKG